MGILGTADRARSTLVREKKRCVVPRLWPSPRREASAPRRCAGRARGRGTRRPCNRNFSFLNDFKLPVTFPGQIRKAFFCFAIPAEMEVELVKVEVDVVGEAEARDDAEREDRDGYPALGQLARPANQARVAAAQLDQWSVSYFEQRLQVHHMFC